MNMHALIERTDDKRLADAIAAASQWTVTAAPIVKAIFAFEDVRWDVLRACDDRTASSVKEIIDKPIENLRNLLDGIRDDFLCDQMPPQPSRDAPDSEWDERDAFQDEVERSIPSVSAFIKQMELEA